MPQPATYLHTVMARGNLGLSRPSRLAFLALALCPSANRFHASPRSSAQAASASANRLMTPSEPRQQRRHQRGVISAPRRLGVPDRFARRARGTRENGHQCLEHGKRKACICNADKWIGNAETMLGVASSLMYGGRARGLLFLPEAAEVPQRSK